MHARILVLLAALCFEFRTFSEVLIVADEFPAMEVVAARLKASEGIASKLVWQTNLPPKLSDFQAIIVYIHRDLSPKAEQSFIDYAHGGGRLVVLHHSISSGKRKNRDWFRFLGVALPEGDVSKGGYKWIEGVEWSVVNLNPSHFITSRKVKFPEEIPFEGSNRQGFTLRESEVYLNHVHHEPRTILLGLRYLDPKTGKIYEQARAGWTKPAGKGHIVYLMAGHTEKDFKMDAYGQIVVNTVVWDGR